MKIPDRSHAPTLRAVSQSIPNKPQHSMSTAPPRADIEGYAGQVVAETLPMLGAMNARASANAKEICSASLGNTAMSSATKLAMGVLLGGSGVSLNAFTQSLSELTQSGMTEAAYPLLQQEAARFLEQPMFLSETPLQQFNELAGEIGNQVAERPDADLAFLVAGVALSAHVAEPVAPKKNSRF